MRLRVSPVAWQLDARVSIALATACSLSLLATPTLAQIRNWNNASGGNYTTASNWTPADVPNTVGETARFPVASSYNVDFASGSSTTVGELVVDDGRVFFQSTGIATYNVAGPVRINTPSEFVLFESGGSGQVDLNGGDAFVNRGQWRIDGRSQSTVESLSVGNLAGNTTAIVLIQGGSGLDLADFETLSIGEQTTGTSTLNVTGSGSRLTASFGNDIDVGSNGVGVMQVLSGGEVKAPLANVFVAQSLGAYGSRLTINNSTFTTFDEVSDGYGVTQVGSGTSTQGILQVLNGGRFEAGMLSFLGAGQGTVDNAELHATRLGLTGTSTLVIQNQGSLELPAFGGDSIGGRSSLTVTGAGSQIQATTGISLSGSTAATPASLNVLAGATFEPITEFLPFGTDLFVAEHAEINVLGADSFLDTGSGSIDLTAGVNSAAKLNVSGGGAAVATDRLRVGIAPGGNGSVRLESGSLLANTRAELAAFDNNGVVTDGGTALVDILPGGMLTSVGPLILGSDATVNLYGGELRVFDFADIRGFDANVNWNNGTVRALDDATLTPYFANQFLPDGKLGFGQTLQVHGELTLQSTVTLDGGTLAVEDLASPSLLQLNSGTFHLLGELHIDPVIGPLGGSVDLGPNTTLKGDLGIKNTGLLAGDGTLVGEFSNDNGTVRVEAGKSLNVTGGAIHANNGELQLLGGRIDFSGDFDNETLGFISGRGTLAVEGTWTNDGTAAFSAGFTDVFGDVDNSAAGTIIATGGATVTFYGDVAHNGVEIRTAANSNTVFLGDVTGAGPFTGTGTNYFEGDLQPGNSAAAVSVAGDVVFGALSELTIELGGTTAGNEFDVLEVAGTASLNGNLEVVYLDDFTAGLGDTFEILTAAGGVNGTFDDESLPDLTGDLEWRVVYNSDSVLLAPILPGDFNGDGRVDAGDYVRWRNNLGDPDESNINNSGDGDGVTAGDYAYWKANYGNTADSGGGSLSTATPEPTTWILVLLASTFLPIAYRRRISSEKSWRSAYRSVSGLMYACSRVCSNVPEGTIRPWLNATLSE